MRIPAGGQGRGPFDSESPRGQVFWGFSYAMRPPSFTCGRSAPTSASTYFSDYANQGSSGRPAERFVNFANQTVEATSRFLLDKRRSCN